jgi:HK97 family phage portal protein
MGLGKSMSTRVGSPPTHNRAIDTWGGWSISDALLSTPGSGAPYEVSGNSHISVYRGVLSIPGVWRAVNVMADLLSGVPWQAFVEREDDVLERIKPNPLLLEQPAPPDVRVTTISSMAFDLILDGNALAIIADRDSRGNVTAISPQPAAWSGVRRNTDTGQVEYLTNGGRVYPASEVVHIKGPTVPGQLWGMGVIEAHFWGSLRLAHDLNKQAGDVSLNGIPTGVYKLGDPDADKAMADATKTGWQAAMATRTIAVMGPYDDFTPLSWNPKDSQLIEARQFSLLEIANIFGLPPSFIGAQSGGSMTYTNIEQESLNVLRYSMRGHLTRMEETLSLCFPSRKVKVKANLNSFLESDTLTRYQGYSEGISAGWLRRSEVRAKERLPVIDGIDDAPQTAHVQMSLNKTMPVTSPAILQPRDPGGRGIEPNPVDGNDQQRAVSKLPLGPGSHLWEYWLHGEGSGWKANPHPWTALHEALLAHAVKGGLPVEQVNGLTTNLYLAVFHHMPPHSGGH